jgi:L,D-peptidoglycan transpeptidase YkuD (ErfK/YbiS/YcfS/YnhG family)
VQILVRAAGGLPHSGTLTWNERAIPCALGRSGIVPAEAKREGDGGTPRGVFPLRQAFFRADRLPHLRSGLPLRPLNPDRSDGWCDGPGDPSYNRYVRLPHLASAERLWRDDHLYDIIVVVGWNDAPPVPGRGSAIFFHVARDNYGPTSGCVAIARDALAAVVASLSPGDEMRIE